MEGSPERLPFRLLITWIGQIYIYPAVTLFYCLSIRIGARGDQQKQNGKLGKYNGLCTEDVE